jgi:hypothetical protein
MCLRYCLAYCFHGKVWSTVSGSIPMQVSLGCISKLAEQLKDKQARKQSSTVVSVPELHFEFQPWLLFFFFFLLGIYFIYIYNAIPKVPNMFPHPLPHPPPPTFWPCRSPVLRHIKFARLMGLSFHWWPTRSSSDTYAARVTAPGGARGGGGYWLVHVVVPPIGLQIPWLLLIINYLHRVISLKDHLSIMLLWWECFITITEKQIGASVILKLKCR